jgi:hypothetical protein
MNFSDEIYYGSAGFAGAALFFAIYFLILWIREREDRKRKAASILAVAGIGIIFIILLIVT